MKIGLGVRGDDRLDPNYLKFAGQIGATHVVLFKPDESLIPSSKDGIWSLDDLLRLKKWYSENNLVIEGFENFAPKLWGKILLGVDGRKEQIENIKQCIKNLGIAGIKMMGYNFTLAGVCNRRNLPIARGKALTPAYFADQFPDEGPLPNGFAWKEKVLDDVSEGFQKPTNLAEMKERLDWFLDEILPVAEESNVKMAIHPEDPPVPVMRGTARIMVTPEAYFELFKKHPSPSNVAEFCQGTFAEMGVDVYETIKYFASNNRIGYVHFRNVKGIVPNYYEEFIDEGDTDMAIALKIYAENGYKGVIMPDHSPDVDCATPQQTGMAYAIGYIRALTKVLKIDIEK